MGSFKRSLFGYRCPDVDSAIAARDAEIFGLRSTLSAQGAKLSASEAELLAQEA
jgi:hypothetical protein